MNRAPIKSRRAIPTVVGTGYLTIKNNLLCEVTTELPIGSELANTFENKFIYEQIPHN